MRVSTALLTAIALALPAGAWAKADEGKRLPLRYRFGLALDGARDIKLGGGGSSVADRVVLGGSAGISWVGIPKLSLDTDLELSLALAPEVGMDRLQLTPGARYDIIQNLYLRAGLPLVFYPSPFNAGLLGGIGYRQSLGGHMRLYAEVGYEHFFLREESRIVLRGGVEAGG